MAGYYNAHPGGQNGRTWENKPLKKFINIYINQDLYINTNIQHKKQFLGKS